MHGDPLRASEPTVVARQTYGIWIAIHESLHSDRHIARKTDMGAPEHPRTCVFFPHPSNRSQFYPSKWVYVLQECWCFWICLLMPKCDVYQCLSSLSHQNWFSDKLKHTSHGLVSISRWPSSKPTRYGSMDTIHHHESRSFPKEFPHVFPWPYTLIYWTVITLVCWKTINCCWWFS